MANTTYLWCGNGITLHIMLSSPLQYVHYGQQSLEPPSSGSITSSTAMTPFSSLSMPPSASMSAPGSHTAPDLGGPGAPLTVPTYPLQPLVSINTSSSFPVSSSPLDSPVAGVTLSPHGGICIQYLPLCSSHVPWLLNMHLGIRLVIM